MRNIFILILLFAVNFRVAFCHFSDKSITKDLTVDSVYHKKSFVKSVIDYFMGNWDTTYVSPNKYNFAFLSNYMTNSEYFNLNSSFPDNQNIQLIHPPQNRIGFYLGWQFLFLGWSFSVDDIFYNNKDDHIDNGSSFQLSLYSSKFGIDLMQIKTGNNFRLRRISGIDNYPPIRNNIPFEGFSARMTGANLYYIINNKRFSYPAAFSQTTVQRRNSGSGIVGLSVSDHKIFLDESGIPQQIRENLNLNMRFGKIRYTNISLSIGYAYNWVIARNVLFSASASPVLAYKVKKEFQNGEDVTGFFKHFNIDVLVRAGIVYNNGKFYVGSSFLGRTYNFNQKDFRMNYGYGSLQLYGGFNFYLKKEYRKAH